MGVTIDSLQIDIQSISTNAAKGIDDLAKSLGNLKKNGSFKTVSNNLNNLSQALSNLPNVHKASNALRTLANSIEKLRGIGSVAGLANSLKKLPEALKAVSNVNIEKVAPQIQRIVDAVAPLSTIKAGGFGSMVNAMKNLGKVTEGLDDATIEKFAEKIGLLDKKLGPFAQKMATVKSAFGAINSSARSAGNSVSQFDDKVDSSMLNLSSFVHVIQTVVQALKATVQKFSDLISEAIEWDGIAARFGRGFAGEASETYAWVQKLNEEMGINVQQFMQFSSIYATMLTGFGVAHEDATTMALGYTELTYDIWAGYNDIYKSFGEAAEAVRSAISGEVEPIRRAGFTIVESQLQVTAANHGLAISLETATEAQKSYLRYLTLVDQAQAQSLVGTYAKEMNTAEGMMRTLSQQLKSLTQAFGSLFLPILVKIVPYLQAFVELLTEGVRAIAAMFGITIQGVDWSDYNSGSNTAIGNTEGVTESMKDATQAAKDLKHATLGIDELNVISPTSATGGAGSGGAGSGGNGFDNLDIDSMWDESIFKDINNQIDELKEKLKGWLPVLSAIGAMFASWGLLSLIQSAGDAMVALSELEGKVGLLKKGLAGLTILTIEAVLVFVLADEYLESGNFAALAGQALATAAGGFLMYKGFGAKGLVLSMAVSILAQLAAITLNLADGGVEMDDPQLWIQAAFTTALGGTAGGYLAYKGLISTSKGKAFGMGALLTLSLTLAAISIGETSANGEATAESIFAGIGSVLAAAGFGFTVGGPWGAVIGAAVGLTVNIVGAAIGAVSESAKKSMEEDLASRFGEIELTAEEVTAYVDKITAVPRNVEIDAKVWDEELKDYRIQSMEVPFDVALDIFVDEKATLDSLLSQVNNLSEDVARDAMKIMLGIEISQKEYQAQIESFVELAQEYLDQNHFTLSMSLSFLGGETGGRLQGVLDEFYRENSGKLVELGEELKETVSFGFANGKWIPEKLARAKELQEEIQEIIDYASDVEYRAALENLSLSISGTDLTPESFQDVLSGATKAIEGKLDALEEVKMSQLQVAVMEYDALIAEGKSEAEAKKIYNQTVADIQAEYEKGKLDLTYGTVTFGLETIQEAFAEELKLIEGFDFGEQISRVVNNEMFLVEIIDTGDGDRYTALRELITNVGYAVELAVDDVEPEVRSNMLRLLEELKPSMASMEDIAAENRKVGMAVPEKVREGLSDYQQIAALSGDAEAINYLIGQKLSTDPTFLNTLAVAEGAGEEIDKSVAEGLLNNLVYVTDESTGLVTGIKDSVNGEVIAVTPTLVENMKDLGVNLSTGLAEGIEQDEPSLWEKIKSWGNGVIDWFKNLFGIHSPSTVMRDEIGKNLSSGIAAGMNQNTIKDKVSSMWTSAKTWWDSKKSAFKSYTPSIGSIYEKLKDRWDNARTWWNEKKAKAKEYTPSIGSIYEKIKDRWDNARTWWNSKKSAMKSYTPAIGSITDKIKSAWNSAKSWWSKNASLSTKLNVQVPKISVKWDTASAFGKEFRYPTGFSLKFAADGGIFDKGSLIWAGERGPEVMAKAAGGKTGVMNVQQMQDAVYEGVYAAMSAAIRSNGGEGQAVNVYLDGRQITAAVEKRQQERGPMIMSNNIYAY